MSKLLQINQVKKKHIVSVFFLMLSFMSFSQAEWVSWKPQGAKSNQLFGTATINGEIVNVAVQVTSTSEQANWYDKAIDDYVIVGGDDWQIVATTLGSYQESLGVDNLSQMALLDHNYYRRPNILTITFDKPVVIETLSYADIDASAGMWTDGHTITGYQFSTVESGGYETTNIQPTITTSGVTFNQETYSPATVGQEYVYYHGTKILQPGDALVVSYHSIVNSKSGRAAGNHHSGFALKLQQPMGKISGTVQEDTSGNRIGDKGIENVTLTLYQDGQPVKDASGTVRTVQTKADGSYIFENVFVGEYSIRQTNLPGYLSVSDSDGGDADEILNRLVVAEQTNKNNKFIDTKPGQLSGQVLEDVNGNKVGDKGISGVPLTIKNTRGFSQIITTQADGSFQIGNIEPSTYTITQTNLSGYYSSSDTDGENDDLITTTILPNQSSENHQFVDVQLATVKGTVNDANGNALETQIQLRTITGSVAKDIKNQPIEVTSLADGSYTLENILPGEYILKQIDLPNYYSVSDIDNVKDGVNDSDLNASQIDSELGVRLNGGEVDTGNNFVDSPSSSISGKVLNTDQVGLPGVLIHLKHPDGRIAKDQFGNELSTTTQNDGSYVFNQVVEGEYNIEEVDLANYYSLQDQDVVNDGSFDLDENNNPSDNIISVKVSYGELSDTGNNFIDYQLGKVKGSVKDDKGEGLQNVTITLKNVNGTIAKNQFNGDLVLSTDSNGNYEIDSIRPGVYRIVETNLGTYDSISDSDDINDGSKDQDLNQATNDDVLSVEVSTGEIDTGNNFVDRKKSSSISGVVKDTNGLGLSNSTVSIRTIFGVLAQDVNGNNLLASTNTEGKFLFTNIKEGNYIIEVDSIDGYEPQADKDVSKDSTDDNDINGSQTDKALPVDLVAGEMDTGNTFVFKKILPATISGSVLNELNNTGIENVRLTLKTKDGQVANDLANQPVTVKTNSSGFYEMLNLAVGEYIIEQSDLAGYISVKDGDEINDGTSDRDINSNGNDNQIEVSLENGEVDTGNNFVDKQTGGLSGVVLEDTDGDGTGDDGISGVTIEVSNASGYSKTVKTDSSGSFSIEEIEPGSYELRQQNLVTYYSSSDSDGVNDDKIQVQIESNQTSSGHEFIDYRVSRITGKVTNVKGAGISTSVQLEQLSGEIATDRSGKAIRVQSGSDGVYEMQDILPGTYKIKQVDLSGYYSVKDGDEINDGVDDQDANPSQTDSTLRVQLKGGEVDTGNNFVDDQVSIISGKVLDTDDVGLQNVTLYLKNTDGSIVTDQSGKEFKVQTDQSGAYIFQNVRAGAYYIEKVNLPNYFTLLEEDVKNDGSEDNDVDAINNDNKLAVRISSGLESDTGNYFVDYQVGKISGLVKDDKGNAINEVSVFVKTSEGAIAKNRLNQEMRGVTSASGQFEFTDVPPGLYIVEAVDKNNYRSISDSDTIIDEARDSDANDNTNDNQLSVKLSTGEEDTGNVFIDQLETATVLGTVKDTSGAPLKNVEVNLTSVTGDIVNDVNGAPLTVITNNLGVYTLENIKAGQYQVVVKILADYEFFSDEDSIDDGVNDKDTNSNQADRTLSVDLIAGELDRGNDFILKKILTATVQGQVQELTGKGGLSGVVITLKTPSGAIAIDKSGQALTTKTLADGRYSFTNVVRGAYYIEETDPSGYVSVSDEDSVKDSVEDSDENENKNDNKIAVTLVSGEVDTGNVFVDQEDVASVSGIVKTTTNEPLVGISITLKNANGDVVTDKDGNELSVLTGADGSYSFLPIPSGNYTVQAGDLLGYTFASDNDDVNDGTLDADTNKNQGDKQLSVGLVAGESDTGNNFYYQKRAVVKGSVKDVNNTPIEGVSVALKDVITNKIVNSILGEPLATTTKADGSYSLYYIPAGDYFIETKDINGYVSKSDGDEVKDSDADVDPNGNSNDNIIPVSLLEGELDTGNNFVDISTTTITGGVLTDTNNDGVGDQPIPGVKVKLLDSDKNPVLVDSSNPTTRTFTQKELIATTNSQGVYTFYNVAPGVYYLQQIQPENYTSMGDAEGDGTDNLIQISVEAGQQVTGQNFVEVEESRSLPVELTYFTAKLNNDSILLEWETASEKDNHYFVVERSLNGFNFTKIGTVNGQGDTTQSTLYSIYDKRMFSEQASVVYYRLKQVDFSGVSEYSKIVSLKLFTKAETEQVSIYPNPVKAESEFVIEWKNLHLVQLFTMQGKMVKEVHLNGIPSVKISTEGLSSGEYILLINGSQSKTIVITH